jgi:hypothetical protein
LTSLLETIRYWAPTLSAATTIFVAVWALFVYRKNSKLERARWASELYKSFYAESTLKLIREAGLLC